MFTGARLQTLTSEQLLHLTKANATRARIANYDPKIDDKVLEEDPQNEMLRQIGRQVMIWDWKQISIESSGKTYRNSKNPDEIALDKFDRYIYNTKIK